MSARISVAHYADGFRRLVMNARVAASVLKRDLPTPGWLGLALFALAVALIVSAIKVEDEVQGVSAEADRLRSESRRAALLRARTQVTNTVAAPIHGEEIVLPGAPDRRSGPVLPTWVFEHAESQGLKLGAVEYRWGRRAGGMQRVDVSLTANGLYVPTRNWLAETLSRMPHAQLLELSIQRPDTSERTLEIRVVIAVHFEVKA